MALFHSFFVLSNCATYFWKTIIAIMMLYLKLQWLSYATNDLSVHVKAALLYGKSSSTQGGMLPYLSSASITEMLHVNRACPWVPLCFGDVYWTHEQPCHCGFISVHSKLLSCPAVTPHPPHGRDLTELTAQRAALIPVAWPRYQTWWGLFFSAISCYVWFLGDTAEPIPNGSADSIAQYMDFDKGFLKKINHRKDQSHGVVVFSFTLNCSTNVIWESTMRGFWMSFNGRYLSYLSILPGFTCREYIQAECVLWAFSSSRFLVDTI